MQQQNIHKRLIAGDTIVEVLIATVVASAVLVGAFTVANKSAISIQAAQERSIALKLTASAVEILKAKSSNASTMSIGPAYCPDLTSYAFSSAGLLPALSGDRNSIYINRTASAMCLSPYVNGEYFTTITKINASDFQVHTRWDRINGGDRQDVTLDYRTDK